jgi:hypothetical protein
MTPEDAKSLLPQVLDQLPGALADTLHMVAEPPLGLVQMVTDRYLAGCDEFAGDWTTKNAEWCEAEAREELADLVTYLAFRRILRDSPMSD